MKKITCLVGLLFIITKLCANVTLYDLRTNYKINPIGVDTKTPELSWKIASSVNNQEQTAYQVLVASDIKKLSPGKADLWDSEKIVSTQSLYIRYGGATLTSGQKCWWKIRVWDKDGNVSEWSEPATFETGLFSPDDWQAEWIKTAMELSEYSYPSPYLRKEFTISKPVKSARLYCTSRGLYEFYLNGQKVGDQVFTPGYTSYEKRLQYQVYDVTSMLYPKANAAGVILGNGWYRVFNPNNLPMQEIQDLEVLAQLAITFTDGSTQIITSDNSWKSSTGSILKSELFNGEIYDARLYPEGWNTPGFDDSKWGRVVVTQSSKENLVGCVSEPVRKIEEIKPVNIIKTPSGEIVFDMGQNMTGWSRLKVNAPAGTVITLHHAEILDQQGNFYTENLRGAKQEIIYTCKGGITELFEPHFTFHGFRYVKVEGYPGELSTGMITGIVIHSDLNMTGSFSCNNKLINQLQHNIVWGQKGNFLDVPTDCPQRNERLGWTGDIQAFAPTACFNMNAASFLTKWLKDLAADQYPDGKIPHVIPDRLRHLQRAGSAGWADAALIVPWNIYLNYGNLTILEEQYESMKGWVDFMVDNSNDNNLWRPIEYQFGDWLSYIAIRPINSGAVTDKDLLASAYFYRSTDILAKTATLLGKTRDMQKYNELLEKIKDAYIKEFITSNGRISSNTQTAYVVALSFGLIPEHLERVAAKRLADDVNQYGHITTGFLGTPDICHVLTKYGYISEAYNLLYRKDYPSWLYPITKGATTIWERWDGIRDDGTFQNPSMNSFNHYAYGAIGNWLYKVVAGINPDKDQPGYKNILLKPYPYGEMNNVQAEYESPYGKIISAWTITNGIIRWTVTIPVNTKAKIFIPSTSEVLKENGKAVSGTQIHKENNLAYHFLYLERGSGVYSFETPLHLSPENDHEVTDNTVVKDSDSFSKPPEGRIAYSSDGNYHDRDDIGANAFALMLLAKNGCKNRLVHFEYGNHIWMTDEKQLADMESATLGAQERFGFQRDIFFNLIADPEAAYNHLAAEINKSSQDNPLIICGAGPMHTIYKAMERAYTDKLQYVTLLSHSPDKGTGNSNNDHGVRCHKTPATIFHCHEGAKIWDDIETDFPQVKLMIIRGQNGSRGAKGDGFNTSDWSRVDWMKNHADPDVRFVYEQMRVAFTSKADPSDAGMIWYILTGDQYGTFEKIKFKNNQ